MRASRGEIKIHEILEANDINFKEEYEFAGLKAPSGRPLRFDFAVFDDDGNLDFLIEYQGKQHYQQSVNLAAIEDCINRNIMIIKRGDSAH